MTASRVAVVLSGCGVFDGTEIHEAVLTLLAIEEAGSTWHCFAPNIDQMHVIDHSQGAVAEGESRNVLVESARIARGEVEDLAGYNPADYDALIFPGGFGGAKNLSDFAVNGPDGTVNGDVAAAVATTQSAGKPLGFICITPASVGAMTLGSQGVALTIGTDVDTADAVVACGATHVNCPVDEAVIDREHKVVSTPAYMLGPGVADVHKGIQQLVDAVLTLCDE
jgi:enhancing lycopene biosynthesis protein 2